MIFTSLKYIYDCLQDEQSKQIFEKRLLFSISQDSKYIDDMVICEMKRYSKNDIISRLIDWMNGRDVYVFGAGFAGQQIVHTLFLNGLHVIGILDNDEKKWGSNYYDIEIQNPGNISPESLVVIGTNAHRQEIYMQLTEMNIDNNNIFMPDSLWWLGKYPQYFDQDIIFPVENEVFIDGGSLDGKDSVSFTRWCNNKYASIYAFEPDNGNLNKMLRTKEKIHDFHIVPKGIWSKNGILKFSSGAGENCLISENGDIEIEVTSIDDFLDGRPSTYIKMDIEGSELEALEGAKNTIRKYKPRLAICVYHNPEDIIEIPLKILKLNSDYKLYLRHYSYLDTETVLYAV